MLRTLVTRKELMERWGLSYNTICNYESNGTLTRNPNFESPMYYMEEIIKIESLHGTNPLSPMERIRKDKKIEELEKELSFYKEKFDVLKTMLS
ncbi:transcription factor [Clostridium sp. HBUAS56017]|uniref:transcription factor n=1 Tax=Clostridium sp. HBUAS56017 TaxID=2571128 RepID=UPI0011782A38|nr:transcription factor [Clostridium sp. HBUAS56017]